jgi:CHAT domain-containing protein
VGHVPGYHPFLLSGLALAGANGPASPDRDDGILTALEVAGMDLSGVEVAVLSACETGLGEVAGGEGVLGLQRAFQVAGAETTVTSLWSVPDLATQLLMQRFYENLWDRGLPKLKALREAQLWLMKEGGRRGLGGLGEDDTGAGGKRLPLHHWAGFVLSGDWR